MAGTKFNHEVNHGQEIDSDSDELNRQQSTEKKSKSTSKSSRMRM